MNLERLIEKHYPLRVQTLSNVREGVGGEVYLADTHVGPFVLKGTPRSDLYAQNEPRVAAYLARQGLPVPEFLRTREGKCFFRGGGRQYNLRPYVEGTVYSYNQAPAWLEAASARMLGKIHAALAGYEPLPTGIGPDFLAFLRSDAPRASYAKTLALAEEAGDACVAQDVRFRLSLLHKLREHSYDLSRFTVGNTHGDYKISQLVCGEGRIAAVIDWTSACTHPLCWEVMRSWAHAAPVWDAGGLHACIAAYQCFAPLNGYDLHMMPYFYRDQLLACDYYGQHYAAKGMNRADYLEQALFATRVLRWMEGQGL